MKRSDDRSPYQQIFDFSTILHGKEIKYVSKPGISDWDQVNPTIHLITGFVQIAPNNAVLYLGCGVGLGGIFLASAAPGIKIYLSDTSSIAMDMCRRNLALNLIENVYLLEEIDLQEDLKGNFDICIISLPKGRGLAQRWIFQAWEYLRMEGSLYLCGSNDQGIQSVVKDAQSIFGQPAILGYKKGNRIARFAKTQTEPVLPDWAIQPGIHPNTWHEFEGSLLGKNLHIYSLPGIFSYDRIDPGTQLLLERIEIPKGARLLDLGCGYGLIGLVGGMSGAERIDFVDTNLIAIAATRKNIHANQVRNAFCFPSDALQAVGDQTYTMILTNPPFHAGMSVDYEMAHAFIQQSWRQLEPHGRFGLVANQFIRYDRLMKPLFHQVEQIGENRGYQVWSGIK